MPQKDSAEKAVRDIRRKTRRKFSAEEKINRGRDNPFQIAGSRLIRASNTQIQEFFSGPRPRWPGLDPLCVISSPLLRGRTEELYAPTSAPSARVGAKT